MSPMKDWKTSTQRLRRQDQTQKQLASATFKAALTD